MVEDSSICEILPLESIMINADNAMPAVGWQFYRKVGKIVYKFDFLSK